MRAMLYGTLQVIRLHTRTIDDDAAGTAAVAGAKKSNRVNVVIDAV